MNVNEAVKNTVTTRQAADFRIRYEKQRLPDISVWFDGKQIDEIRPYQETQSYVKEF